VYFRYLWLEVLGTPEARAVLSSVISQVVIEDAIRDSRRLYLNRLYDIYRTATQKLNPTWAAAKVKEQAQKTAADELFKGLHKWFGLNKDAYDSWLATASATMPPAGTDAEGSTDADDQEDDVTADAAARAIEDMLSDQ
jgi:hypothetical protein